jgi:hypothetical protein
LTEGTLKAVIAALGVFHLALGGLALIDAQTFFDEIGTYAVPNLHYVGDVGAFTAAYGVALLVAASRPAWWTPLLALGAIWYGLHALNHAFDIDEARSDARGTADTLLIAATAVALGWLAAVASRRDRDTPGREGEEVSRN